ncbi:DUF805 domain-containing protein [Jannaschia sp. KMU-145]|uniref:DUF805 domain-containing protein n=1 Tax=Jannaschia halovivens TaxID=3388667 RepID=UPI00396B0D11
MTFTDAVRTVLREKYATFSGRAARSEFWWFYLFTLVAGLAISLIDRVIFGVNEDGDVNGLFGFVFALAIIVPSIAVAIRRLHDRDRSGWWMLLCLVPLIGGLILIFAFWIRRGTEGPNRFGPDPLAPGALGQAETGPVASSSIPKVDR